MMRRPWVVGVEVPGEGIGEGRHGRAAGVVPPEWWGAPGRRHAVRTVIKAMMAQLRPPVLLVLRERDRETERETETEREICLPRELELELENFILQGL